MRLPCAWLINLDLQEVTGDAAERALSPSCRQIPFPLRKVRRLISLKNNFPLFLPRYTKEGLATHCLREDLWRRSSPDIPTKGKEATLKGNPRCSEVRLGSRGFLGKSAQAKAPHSKRKRERKMSAKATGRSGSTYPLSLWPLQESNMKKWNYPSSVGCPLQ